MRAQSVGGQVEVKVSVGLRGIGTDGRHDVVGEAVTHPYSQRYGVEVGKGLLRTAGTAESQYSRNAIGLLNHILRETRFKEHEQFAVATTVVHIREPLLEHHVTVAFLAVVPSKAVCL